MCIIKRVGGKDAFYQPIDFKFAKIVIVARVVLKWVDHVIDAKEVGTR